MEYNYEGFRDFVECFRSWIHELDVSVKCWDFCSRTQTFQKLKRTFKNLSFFNQGDMFGPCFGITMLSCCSLSFSLDMPGGCCASWWGTSSWSFWRTFSIERAGKLSISTAIWVICIDDKSWSKSVQNSQICYHSFRLLDFNVRNKFMKGSFDWVKWDRTPHRIVLCFVLVPLCAPNFQGWWVKTLRRDQRSWWKKSCSNWDILKRWHSPYQIMQ